MRHALLLFILCAGLAGCGLGKSQPQVRYYTLTLPLPAAPTPTSGEVILVRRFSARDPYGQARMAYRLSQNRMDFDNLHLWASLPAEQVAEWCVRSLRASGRFAQVVSGPDASAGLVLSGQIREFEEVDRGATWEAALGIDLWVSRSDQPRPLLFRSYHAVRPAARRNPEAVAAAMSQNLEQVLGQFLRDLDSALGRSQPRE